MQLINSTRMVAGFTTGLEPSGRELLIVVVKGTFRMPTQAGESLRLQDEQVPLVMADVFHGEPGLSAPKYEVDFAPRKHRCDILLNGSAYARPDEPAERIGTGQKTFAVVGNRMWDARGGIRATPPQPFSVMPVSYDYAFGGADLRH